MRIDCKLSRSVDYYLAFVVHLALKPMSAVVQVWLTGSRTSGNSWGFCLVVRSSLVSSAPRVAVFWIWHFSLTLNSSIFPIEDPHHCFPRYLRYCHRTSASEIQSRFDSGRFPPLRTIPAKASAS
jgi:hypothetical protein